MLIRSKNLLYNLIFLITIIISLLLVAVIMRHNHTKITKTSDHYDAFMTKLTYNAYDQNGHLESHLVTPKMLHYDKENMIYFTTPKIDYYSANHPPWKIKARFGITKQKKNTLRLWDHVNMHEQASKQQPETTILTDAITINLKNSTARSKDYVTMIRPGTHVEGKGLKADFKKGVFELLSQSKGVYKPQAEKKHSTFHQ